MKAIRVLKQGGPEVLTLSEIDKPSPSKTQVVVKVQACGVNPVDTYLRSGTNNYKITTPWTPGHDAAGVIDTIGDDVTNVKVGDRVWTQKTQTGSYAQYTLCEATDVNPLPENVSFEQGAAVNVPYATAYFALKIRGRAKPGETVLIHGASGGVGVAATQFAKGLGMTIIGTAGTKEGLELIKKNGCHFAFNHREEGYLDAISAATGGKGVDIVLEMLANVNLQKDLELLALRGRVAIIGNRGSIEINPRNLMGRLGDILGVALAHATPEDRKEINAAIYAGLSNGTLSPMIWQSMALADASKAHEQVINPPKGAQGKLILTPW